MNAFNAPSQIICTRRVQKSQIPFYLGSGFFHSHKNNYLNQKRPLCGETFFDDASVLPLPKTEEGSHNTSQKSWQLNRVKFHCTAPPYLKRRHPLSRASRIYETFAKSMTGNRQVSHCNASLIDIPVKR